MASGGTDAAREVRITELLDLLRGGNDEELKELFALLYDELHELAHRQRQRLAPQPTLNTTALLHEAYVKFADKGALGLEDRNHFLALAARVMRHLLIDNARKAGSVKRGAGLQPVTLERVADPESTPAEELLALDEALNTLQAVDKRLVRLVEMRFFGGMSNAEVADVFAVSERTLKRDWRKAKALLLDLMTAPAAS